MQSIQIQWRATSVDQLSTEKYAHFLSVSRGGAVLYIANAYRRNLAAAFAELDLQQGEVVHIGRINPFGMRSISPEVVDSLHSLLLNGCKPMMNGEGKYRYSGLQNIRLNNVGLSGMPAFLRAEEGRVFTRAHALVTASAI